MMREAAFLWFFRVGPMTCEDVVPHLPGYVDNNVRPWTTVVEHSVLELVGVDSAHLGERFMPVAVSGRGLSCLPHLEVGVGVVARELLPAPAGDDVAVAMVLHLASGGFVGLVGEAAAGEHETERAGRGPARHERPPRAGRVEAHGIITHAGNTVASSCSCNLAAFSAPAFSCS